MTTRKWVTASLLFFDAQLLHRSGTAEDAQLLGAASDRIGELFTRRQVDLPAGVPWPRPLVSDPARLASDWLQRYLPDLEASFFVDVTDPDEIEEMAKALDEGEVTFASALGAPIGMLARWALSPYELMLPLGPGPHLHLPWPTILETAASTELGPDQLVEYVALEALVAHAIVSDPEYTRACRHAWRLALSCDEVDTELLLGRAWRPNPASTSWDDHMIIVDPDAMIDAFMAPDRAARVARLAELTGRARAAVQVLTDRLASELLPATCAVLRRLVRARRADPGELDLFLHTSLGTRVWTEPTEVDVRAALAALDRAGIAGVRAALLQP